ncbi:hypothetical protein SBRCBS47491_009625 [Sporothrix bragantina]|uniref:Secreted protein n=1 Tax=Sporothrix bragantina TaxID=671064 RepID=A0ABP0CWA5_9PEZI
MKLLFQLLLAVLAATLTLAAPTRHLQLPLADKYQHSLQNSHAVAKSPSKSTPTQTTHTPKIHLPFVVKAPASEAHAHKKHRLSVPSWLKLGKGRENNHYHSNGMYFTHKSSADLSCFCAGGAVCCHTATGLDCNAGYCGI